MYFSNPETTKVYLPKRQQAKIPEPSLILTQENNIFLHNQQEAILFTPPGAQLTQLFEKRLGINFTHVDLDYLQQNLPRLFIDDLELAENFEIEIDLDESPTTNLNSTSGRVQVKITNLTLKETDTHNNALSNIYTTTGSPISSAIACALTKVTGRPVIINEAHSSPNGKTIEITYNIEVAEYKEQPIEYKEFETILEPIEPIEYHQPTNDARLQQLTSLILIILGAIILIWIGQLTWYETAVWGKTIQEALFAARTGEAISLGIGMRLIYYLLIGLALVFSGIFLYNERGQT